MGKRQRHAHGATNLYLGKWIHGRTDFRMMTSPGHSLGLLETTGWTPAIVALDRMEKSGDIRVFQAEINDFLGVIIKIVGPLDDVRMAIENGYAVAERMNGSPVRDIIARPAEESLKAIQSAAEYNPLIQQAVVTFPNSEWLEKPMADQPDALGFIETQGFTAVFEAIDTACKAANVDVIGKEKLGGGYVTVVIQGDVAAVNAAIASGSQKVEGLGKLIAAHVVTRPSPAVLSLLPQ